MRGIAALLCLCILLTARIAAGADASAPSLSILQPLYDEVIYDNTGAVPVSVVLQGAALASGNRLRVLLDDNPLGADRGELAFTLKGVERGTHTLQVQLIDAANKRAAASPTVTFHVWQASVLMPARKPQPR